jgi:hypothetical protein
MPIVMSESRPGGIEPRAGDEAEVVARGPPRIAAGDDEERIDAGLRAAGTNARETLRDERAVETIEAHDVGDRAQRDEIEQRAEIRLRAILERAALAEQRTRREQHVEHHADAGEVLARKRAPALVGIDDQRRRRKCRGRQVMIGDQHLDAERGGGGLRRRGSRCRCRPSR